VGEGDWRVCVCVLVCVCMHVSMPGRVCDCVGVCVGGFVVICACGAHASSLCVTSSPVFICVYKQVCARLFLCMCIHGTHECVIAQRKCTDAHSLCGVY